MGLIARTMEARLREAFAPTRLEIRDESALHAGHAGARGGGESHFAITIQADAFAGLTRVQRQRLVHGVLAGELAGPVHALSLKALAPGEG